MAVGAVVFDCDGVLVDSEPHSAASWVEVLGRYGHRAEVSDVAACTGLGFRPTYEHLAAVDPTAALPGPEALWPELLDALARSVARGLLVVPDAAACVADLAAGAVAMGVASSSPRERLDLTLEHSGLGRYFAATASGDEVRSGKPAPDVYLLAADRLGSAPGACLAVEDTGPGAQAAAAAGMRVLGVARSDSDEDALRAAGATLVDTLDAGFLRTLLPR
jgi:beta-phosphoglucomutase-like phosphatase (HAD superfamily)